MFSRSGKPRFRGWVVLLLVTLLSAALLNGCGSPSGTASSPQTYYLALGDSLAVGIQPNAEGQSVTSGKGYVNDIYAHVKGQLPNLKLVDMGCPGDTTANVLTGEGNATAAAAYRCDRADGSQLSAAVAFIQAHRSQVRLISINIGANDVLGCFNPVVYSQGVGPTAACIIRGEASVATNLPKILGRLKAAAAPGTALVGGTVYDPYLVGVLDRNPTVKAFGEASLTMMTKVNQEVTRADSGAGFKTADVADAFAIHDATEVISPALKTRVPKALAVLCAFTYMCTSSPQGPNIHPKTVGYRAMAVAYEQQMGSL